MVSGTALLAAGLCCGLALVAATLWLTRRGGIVDQPNHRSSHVAPTPTLGGVAIVMVMLAHVLTATGVSSGFGWGVFVGLLALTVVSLWDDLLNAPAIFRLLVHGFASMSVLVSLDMHALYPAWQLAVVWVGMIWLINLYNFMDGIDGYAAVQCLVFCLGAQWLAGGLPGWLGQSVWLLTGVTLGFLVFNWAPAKIFMGDVGSGFLGLYIGTCTLLAWQQHLVPLTASAILLAGFWFDATYTLAVRALTGQPFAQAHRLHLYQYVARAKGHAFATSALLLFGMLWLLPLAWASVTWPEYELICVFVSILPLAWACVSWRAGRTGRTLDEHNPS